MPTLLDKSLGSADLTKPTASLNYVIGATVAIGALVLAVGFGQQLGAWTGGALRGLTGIGPSQGYTFAA